VREKDGRGGKGKWRCLLISGGGEGRENRETESPPGFPPDLRVLE